MDVSDWLALAGLVVAVGVPSLLWRKLHSLATMAEDWRGRPERRDPMTGVVIDPGRASMPGRMASVETAVAQLSPNHGTSMHDQLSRLVTVVEQIQRERAQEVRQ